MQTNSHQLLNYFSFDPGSYGSISIPVIQACKAITDEVESNSDKFSRHLVQSPPYFNRMKVARLIDARVDECVFVLNAIHGINTVLNNIKWRKGPLLEWPYGRSKGSDLLQHSE